MMRILARGESLTGGTVHDHEGIGVVAPFDEGIEGLRETRSRVELATGGDLVVSHGLQEVVVTHQLRPHLEERPVLLGGERDPPVPTATVVVFGLEHLGVVVRIDLFAPPSPVHAVSDDLESPRVHNLDPDGA